jgi:hypothetical protein
MQAMILAERSYPLANKQTKNKKGGTGGSEQVTTHPHLQVVLLARPDDMLLLDRLKDNLLSRQLVLAQQHAPERARTNLLNLLKLAEIVPEPRLCCKLLKHLRKNPPGVVSRETPFARNA